ncbi:hypothetical protein GQ651_00635 [Alphaproteobacteria bacterium GH1-50]|uniref:Tetratricopeptide repeat protein n=1 Tax=Kangsaoukella pontilimi TaxID=2691042 RepID=A0A7C9J0T2_9RHOB|nr:hypothetical protein [Kangsaoukella pontilimi]MXQ06341.1 hypothetical protein [Kangsaoukella pontilimi]
MDQKAEPDNALTFGDPALLTRVAWTSRWCRRTQSVEYAKRALAILKGEKSQRAITQRGLALMCLSWQAKWRGDFDLSMQEALRVEGALPEDAFPVERAHIYSVLGVIHYSRHRLDLADCSVQRGLMLVAHMDSEPAHVDLLTTLATIQRHGGNRQSAGEILGKARSLAEGAELARVEHNVARWMQADDAPAHALEHAERALELADTFNNRVILPYAHEVAGACLIDLGELDRAEAHFTDGLTIATEDEDTRAQCQIVGWHAQLEKERGNLGQARDLYRFGSEIARKMDYTLWEKIFARGLADVYEGLGDFKASVEAHKMAWKLEAAKRQ